MHFDDSEEIILNDIDHDNPAAQALAKAAAAVDDRLPGAWSRVADYLDAYKDATGVLGRRKLDADTPAELRAEDLHVLSDALGTVLEATIGPDEEPARTDPTPAEIAAFDESVFYADVDLRDEVVKRATTALSDAYHSAFDPGHDEIEAVEFSVLAGQVVAAVWAPIEQMGFVGAAALARGEAEEHEEGCHGRRAGEFIAEAILHGDDGEDRERDACSTTLVFEQNGIGLDALAGKLDELLERVSPKQVLIKFDHKLSSEAVAKMKADFAKLKPGQMSAGGVVSGPEVTELPPETIALAADLGRARREHRASVSYGSRVRAQCMGCQWEYSAPEGEHAAEHVAAAEAGHVAAMALLIAREREGGAADV